MNIIYHNDIEQGTPDWHALRCGLITASIIGDLVKKNGDIANNETSRSLINAIALQRLNGYSDYTPTTFAMARGHDDEEEARDIYSDKISQVKQLGFITCEFDGIKLGYSPDGLVGDDGLIEVKSRGQKYQLDTIINGEVPERDKAQVQAGLMISGRAWCDFISYPACGGGKMVVIRAVPDKEYQEKLMASVKDAEEKINHQISLYNEAINNGSLRVFDTERRDYSDPSEVEFL